MEILTGPAKVRTKTSMRSYRSLKVPVRCEGMPGTPPRPPLLLTSISSLLLLVVQVPSAVNPDVKTKVRSDRTLRRQLLSPNCAARSKSGLFNDGTSDLSASADQTPTIRSCGSKPQPKTKRHAERVRRTRATKMNLLTSREPRSAQTLNASGLIRLAPLPASDHRTRGGAHPGTPEIWSMH